MKFLDENELIAYHFRELTPRRTTEVREMLETDADAVAAFAALEEMLEAFRDYGPAPVVNAAVVERNWQAVRASLPYMGARPVKVGWGRAFQWHPLGMGLAGLGAAALIGLGVMMVLPSRRAAAPVTGGAEHAAAVAPSPAVGGLPVVGDLNGHRVVAERVNGRAGPLTTAPVMKDDSWVKDAVLVVPATPLPEVAAAPSPVKGEFGHSGSTLAFSDGQAGVGAAGRGQSEVKTKRMREWLPLPMRETDVALGGFGDVSAFSYGSNTSTTESSRPAAGARISFHQQFNRWLGYEVAFGGSHTTFFYASNAVGPYIAPTGNISSDVFEMSLTYEVQGPRSKRISSFANVGGGTVLFEPAGSTSAVSANYHPTPVIGLGGEYHATGHWGVRVAYRGMLLAGPTFDYTGATIPVASHKMWSSEPTVSVVYHFGTREKD